MVLTIILLLSNSTKAWVAKHKILSLPKKTRYRKYEQAAKRAVGNKDYTTAANIYEGLVRTIHSFDNYYGLGLCLLHSKSGSEVHHYRSRIELALVRASECIENIDQQIKVLLITEGIASLIILTKQVDMAKNKLLEKLGTTADNEGNFFTFDILYSNARIPIYFYNSASVLADNVYRLSLERSIGKSKSANYDLSNRFKIALKNYDQPSAMNCISEGLPLQVQYKVSFDDPKTTDLIRHLSEQCLPKNTEWALWLIRTYSDLLKNLSLLRVAMQYKRREIVSTLLELELTYDHNDKLSHASRDQDDIIHLASKYDYPNVIALCYNNDPKSINHFNRANLSPLMLSCQNASINAFKQLLEYNADVNSRYSSQGQETTIQLCIDYMSSTDISVRLEMIKILLDKELPYTNQGLSIIEWTLQRNNSEWLEKLMSLLRDDVKHALITRKPLPFCYFCKDLCNWDINEIEKVVNLTLPVQLLSVERKTILDAIFNGFNDLDANEAEETKIALVFKVIQKIAPHVELVNYEQTNILEYIATELIVDDNHLPSFFRCLANVGFNQWNVVSEQLATKITQRFKRLCAAQKYVEEIICVLPEEFNSKLLFDVIKSESNILSIPAEMLIKAICTYGKLSRTYAQQGMTLIKLAKQKKLSVVVDKLK